MKNFSFIKLFTFTLLFLFTAIVVQAKEVTYNNISRVIIDPIKNNTCTLNIYFDNTYKSKAFIQKISDDSYTVFIPDTRINNKKIKVIYKNNRNKKDIKLSFDQKPYLNKGMESNYIIMSINMNNGYSLKLLSKTSKDYHFMYSTNNLINTFSLFLLGLIILMYLTIRKLSKLIKESKRNNNYTIFPNKFSVRKKSNTKFLKHNRNIKCKSNTFTTKPNFKIEIKAADKNAFACFDIPSIVKQINNTNAYEYKSSIKQTSTILKSKNNIKSLHSNPINYNESEELDLPSVDELRKEEQQEKEKNAELLSILSITPTKGFYLTTYENTIALFGYIGESVFLLQKFSDLSQINLQARFYDKNGDNDVYIVRLDSYKAMVEISNDSIKELVVL